MTPTAAAVFVTRVFRLSPVDLSGRLNLWYGLVFVVYYCYGTQLSVYASTTGDFFGTKNLGVNYGLVFTGRVLNDVGFFQLVNHGIDLTQVQGAFDMAQRFFALPDGVKAQYPLQRALNSGWESRAQVRPSTGTQDQKESYQITLPHMAPLWPSEDELPGFRAAMLAFETQCWQEIGRASCRERV